MTRAAPTDGALRETDVGQREPLPPADVSDPLIEVYKRDVDRTLLRENLKLTTEERSQKFARNMAMVFELRQAAARSRGAGKATR